MASGSARESSSAARTPTPSSLRSRVAVGRRECTRLIAGCQDRSGPWYSRLSTPIVISCRDRGLRRATVMPAIGEPIKGFPCLCRTSRGMVARSGKAGAGRLPESANPRWSVPCDLRSQPVAPLIDTLACTAGGAEDAQLGIDPRALALSVSSSAVDVGKEIDLVDDHDAGVAEHRRVFQRLVISFGCAHDHDLRSSPRS